MIVGLGKTGLSCARYLHAQGEEFVVVDSRFDPPGLSALRSEFPEVRCELGNFNESTLANASRLIISPGVSMREKAVERASRRGVPVTGDIDIFSQVAEAPLVAITGSNGKSTVVTLIAEICRLADMKFGLGGNLESEEARPALDLLGEPDLEIYILELSSFQLETTHELGAEVSVILNFSEDHMDRYENLNEYLQAKQRIFNGAKKIVVNRDCEYSRPPASVAGEIVEFGLREPEAGNFGVRRQAGEDWLAFGEENLLRADDLKVIGQHNISNVLAAMAVCKAVNVDIETIVNGVRNFTGLPHRCQWIDKIDGVDYYNDSKGTNVGATLAAVEGLGQKLKGKVVLIAGGVSKGADFSPLIPAVRRFVSSVILIGSAANELAEVLDGLVPAVTAKSMQEAVFTAKEKSRPGDAVLLSPACASFDMFSDFKHRGQEFINQVRSL